VAIELAERPVSKADVAWLCGWLAGLEVIPIGKLEVRGGQLIDCEIRFGGAGLEASGEELPQEPLIFGPALWGAKATQIVVFAVDGNDRSARWPMATERRNAEGLGHSRSDLNPVITGLRDH